MVVVVVVADAVTVVVKCTVVVLTGASEEVESDESSSAIEVSSAWFTAASWPRSKEMVKPAVSSGRSKETVKLSTGTVIELRRKTAEFVGRAVACSMGTVVELR